MLNSVSTTYSRKTISPRSKASYKNIKPKLDTGITARNVITLTNAQVAK